MELGIIGFGNRAWNPDGQRFATDGEVVRTLVEAARLADEVGLDFFGVGEHHRQDSPVPAPAVVLAAAAAVTQRIRLGSAISVLGADDPIRVFEQFSTLDGLSSGRAELVVGRGAFAEPFALFDVDPRTYDDVFAEKLDLLSVANRNETVNWAGSHRPPLRQAVIVPRPDQTQLPLWLATGGQPQSVLLAVRHGMSVLFSALGGTTGSFGPLADLYRTAAERAGLPERQRRVGLGTVGLVGRDSRAVRDLYETQFLERMQAGTGPLAASYRANYRKRVEEGFFLVGSPTEVTDRILEAHAAVGMDRLVIQSDIGSLTRRDLLQHIELLGTEVLPAVHAALPAAAPLAG